MTNLQLYLAIGVPVLVNAAMFALLMLHLNTRLDDLKELWRSELHRIERLF